MNDKNDGLDQAFFIDPSERDPLRAVAEGGRPKLLKRFYKEAAVAPRDGGFAVALDGKPLLTPARATLVLPTTEMAQAIAGEWAGQGETIDFATLPLTRLANSAFDGVSKHVDEVEADVAKYAASDLICYRAGEPETLVRAEAAAFDPLLRFARDKCGARLILAEGVVFQAQPEAAVAALAAAIRAYVGKSQKVPGRTPVARDELGAPHRLAALHAMTTLTGSCVIALAVALGEIDADAGFAAAQTGEDYQMRVWGADAEALARRERRLFEMRAAAHMARLAAAA